MSSVKTTPAVGSIPRRSNIVYWLMQDTMVGLKRRRALLGYLFLLPTLLGILVFTAGPVFWTLGLSFYRWNIFRPPDYIGVSNYTRLVHDAEVIISFKNTLKFVAMAASLQITLALFLAMAVHRLTNKLLRYYFRTAFFLPLLLSGASVAIFMGYIFHKEFGALNYYLHFLGLPRIPWLTESGWTLVTVVIVSVWRNVGFTFVIFLGGLTNISKEVLEAADVDGATGWRRLRHVTLPLLSPSILFAAVTSVIGGLQVFEEPFIMTRGGPGDASRTAVMVIYEAAFKNIEFGYGSAIAVLLFLLILAVTVFQMRISKLWVFYQ
jgi:multiple sugar transport system permease protein